MIAVVRTRTLQSLRTGLAEAQAAADSARAEAEQHRKAEAHATDSAIRAEAAAQDLLRETAEATAATLRAEQETKALRRQLAEATCRAATPRWVYVLLHCGELHSVHDSQEAAEKAAEAESAGPGRWVTVTNRARPARDVPWRIQPTAVGAGAR